MLPSCENELTKAIETARFIEGRAKLENSTVQVSTSNTAFSAHAGVDSRSRDPGEEADEARVGLSLEEKGKVTGSDCVCAMSQRPNNRCRAFGDSQLCVDMAMMNPMIPIEAGMTMCQ